MEQNSDKRYEELARKWMNGSITPAEEEEYAHWYNQDDGQPLEVPTSFADGRATQQLRIWRAIQTRLAPVRHISRIWLRAASVAAILLLAGGGYWYLHKKSSPSLVVNVAENNDIRPGTTKAVLTLANGQKIVLDSATMGLLATQGNTRISSQSGGLTYQGQGSTTSSMYNTLSTSRGEQFPLTLSDGTRIWLNSASSIRFPVAFTEPERTVEITGEAYFEVAHDVTKPFIVRKVSDHTSVRVLGTHFNVNSYDDEAALKVTLMEGSVKVSKGNITGLLHPGQQASLPRSKDGQLHITQVDTEDVMAWKNGYFSFNQADLTTVMRQLARWYDVKIVYQGEPPTMKFWGGIARNSNLSQVLKVLEESNIHFRVQGKTLTVLP